MTAGTPNHGIATVGDAGRSCPYCRFPLKEGAAIVGCGVCACAHHGDCWADNRGCAVVACAGGPAAPGQASRSAEASLVDPAAAYAPSAPVVPAPTPFHAAPAPAPARGQGPWLAVAVVALALAIGGSAVAVVASQDDGPAVATAADTVVPATETVTVETEAESAPEPETTPSEAAEPDDDGLDGKLPDVSKSEMRSDIETVLVSHHRAIVDGNHRRAWELLTARKRRSFERRFGYSGWVRNQDSLAAHLGPEGLRATIEERDNATGVVRVLVSGMSWSKPGASCTSWSGVTWMKYEGGEWRYDPGYITTPQREQEWKDRFSETLGGSC